MIHVSLILPNTVEYQIIHHGMKQRAVQHTYKHTVDTERRSHALNRKKAAAHCNNYISAIVTQPPPPD